MASTQIDEYTEAERLLGWMSFAFGVTLLLSPEVKSFALMARVAPLPYWGVCFMALGTVTEVASRLNERAIRIALMAIRSVAWACVLATYINEFWHARTIYPTQAVALVCIVHSIMYGLGLWRAGR